MLYDSFAKALLNPETVPERLNELLSLLFGRDVKILHALPNDNSRIADESSLLIMDILVKMDDGGIANVEIQKIGYKFPDTYLHYFHQKSNTGLEIELLQKYLFIPIDIFLKKHHNKNINNRLEAWLTFLGSDNPEDIISVIEHYPDFKCMYEQVYEISRNIEGVMEMFSKELQILDRNTVRYMIDELKNEIDQQKELLSQKDQVLKERDLMLSQKDVELKEKEEMLDQKDEALEQVQRQLQEALRRIDSLEKK